MHSSFYSKPSFYYTLSLSLSLSQSFYDRNPPVAGHFATPPSSASSPSPPSPAPAPPPTLCRRVILFLHLQLHIRSVAIAIATTAPSSWPPPLRHRGDLFSHLRPVHHRFVKPAGWTGKPAGSNRLVTCQKTGYIWTGLDSVTG